jgi:hypothetical protein
MACRTAPSTGGPLVFQMTVPAKLKNRFHQKKFHRFAA